MNTCVNDVCFTCCFCYTANAAGKTMCKRRRGYPTKPGIKDGVGNYPHSRGVTSSAAVQHLGSTGHRRVPSLARALSPSCRDDPYWRPVCSGASAWAAVPGNTLPVTCSRSLRGGFPLQGSRWSGINLIKLVLLGKNIEALQTNQPTYQKNQHLKCQNL